MAEHSSSPGRLCGGAGIRPRIYHRFCEYCDQESQPISITDDRFLLHYRGDEEEDNEICDGTGRYGPGRGQLSVELNLENTVHDG